jgi:hypothetical protein
MAHCILLLVNYYDSINWYYRCIVSVSLLHRAFSLSHYVLFLYDANCRASMDWRLPLSCLLYGVMPTSLYYKLPLFGEPCLPFVHR